MTNRLRRFNYNGYSNSGTSISILLRKKHRFTWLVFGSFFLMFAYNWGGKGGILDITPVIQLLVIYFLIGQATATLIAHFFEQSVYGSVYDPAMILFFATCKGGGIASLLSVMLHIGLVWLGKNSAWSWLPDFRSVTFVLIGSPIFAFMASLSATATLEKQEWT